MPNRKLEMLTHPKWLVSLGCTELGKAQPQLVCEFSRISKSVEQQPLVLSDKLLFLFGTVDQFLS